MSRGEYISLFEIHDANREWFQENYEKLTEEYDDMFVAIYNRGVVDSDPDLDTLLERIEDRFPVENVSIEYVSKDKIQLIP